MELQKYGIQGRVSFNILYNVTQIIQGSAVKESILLQEVLRRLYIYGKLVFTID